MKTIGLIGGMSWQSTQTYYAEINQQIADKLGGLHSAKICLVSVDFQEIETLQMQGHWHEAGQHLARAAQQVEAGGADFILICTNTMHKVADHIEAAVSIPILHIADATADVLTQQGIDTVGLLGTGFTMSQDFYKGRIQDRHGIAVRVPNEAQQKRVHDVIYEELCLGKINVDSKQAYLAAIDSLVADGAQGIILGCTEIGLLIQQSDTDIPLFDTTAIHAMAAVEYALK